MIPRLTLLLTTPCIGDLIEYPRLEPLLAAEGHLDVDSGIRRIKLCYFGQCSPLSPTKQRHKRHDIGAPWSDFDGTWPKSHDLMRPSAARGGLVPDPLPHRRQQESSGVVFDNSLDDPIHLEGLESYV